MRASEAKAGQFDAPDEGGQFYIDLANENVELAEKLEGMTAAYEAKIQDLARETRRSTVLVALAVRLYDVMMNAAIDFRPWNDRDFRRLFDGGFPPEEREALTAALVAHGKELDAAEVRGGEA